MKNIVWIDCETSGLDYTKDTIIQIACIITDFNLNILAKSQEYVINKPQNVMDNMNEWCKVQHHSSGLTLQVLQSNLTLEFVKNDLLNFIKTNTEKGSNLAGNSVHFDKCFLQSEIPEIIEYLGYQIIDVTSFKLVLSQWNANFKPFIKSCTHTAMSDIMESINELKHYKNMICYKN